MTQHTQTREIVQINISFFEILTADLLADNWFQITDCYSDFEKEVSDYVSTELSMCLTDPNLELLISDQDGYGYLTLDSDLSLEEIFKISQGFLEYGDRLRALTTEINDLETCLSCVNRVSGPYKYFKDYVYEILDTYEGQNVPQFFFTYFDFEMFRQDLSYEGIMFPIY